MYAGSRLRSAVQQTPTCAADDVSDDAAWSPGLILTQHGHCLR